jgi:predicted phage terminase large subunit-like protein
VIELALEHCPERILIEKAGPGLHMIQDLRFDPVDGVPIPIGIQPEGDKVTRMAAQSARFEAGQVHLPRDAPWLADFLHEMLAFPNGRFDDQVDSVSQFLNWAEARDSFGIADIVCGPKIFRDGREIC